MTTSPPPPPPRAARRFTADAVPLAVEIVDGAAVTLRTFADGSSSELEPKALAGLLAVGMVTPDDDEDLVPVGEIAYAGVRFLVGEAELDPAVGWDAVERGLRVAAARALDDHGADTVRGEPGRSGR